MFNFSKLHIWKTKFDNNLSFPALKNWNILGENLGKFNGVWHFIVSNNLTKVYFISNSPFKLLYITLLVIRESPVSYFRHQFTGWNVDIVKKSNIFLTSVTWKSLKNRSKRDQNNQALINDMRGAYNIYWRSYEQAVIQHPSFRCLWWLF